MKPGNPDEQDQDNTNEKKSQDADTGNQQEQNATSQTTPRMERSTTTNPNIVNK